jgi:hypothetical protein
VKPKDVSNILDELLQFREQHMEFSAERTKPLCIPFWRGRMGTDKEEQLKLANIVGDAVQDYKPLTPHPSRT